VQNFPAGLRSSSRSPVRIAPRLVHDATLLGPPMTTGRERWSEVEPEVGTASTCNYRHALGLSNHSGHRHTTEVRVTTRVMTGLATAAADPSSHAGTTEDQHRAGRREPTSAWETKGDRPASALLTCAAPWTRLSLSDPVRPPLGAPSGHDPAPPPFPRPGRLARRGGGVKGAGGHRDATMLSGVGARAVPPMTRPARRAPSPGEGTCPRWPLM
jgi:hypothetical protein